MVKGKALDGRNLPMEAHLQSSSSGKNSEATCASGVYPSVLRSQISFWNKNVGLCHSKAKNCISPALQSHEKFEGT